MLMDGDFHDAFFMGLLVDPTDSSQQETKPTAM